MKLPLLLAFLIVVAPGAASDVDHVQALFDSPWPDVGEAPDWLSLMADIDRISQGDLTLGEWVVVLGPGHGYNVTRDGIVTLDDGQKIDIKIFLSKITLGKLWGRAT